MSHVYLLIANEKLTMLHTFSLAPNTSHLKKKISASKIAQVCFFSGVREGLQIDNEILLDTKNKDHHETTKCVHYIYHRKAVAQVPLTKYAKNI